MKSSVAQMEAFISSYAGRPDLNVLLHEPALKKGSSSAEVLPVKLLREFDGAVHLRSPESSIADFCSRLPSISAAGLHPRQQTGWCAQSLLQCTCSWLVASRGCPTSCRAGQGQLQSHQAAPAAALLSGYLWSPRPCLATGE